MGRRGAIDHGHTVNRLDGEDKHKRGAAWEERGNRLGAYCQHSFRQSTSIRTYHMLIVRTLAHDDHCNKSSLLLFLTNIL